MAFTDYSSDPAENTSIAGINIAENCPAGNLNDVCRQLAADGKTLADAVSALGSYMPVTGGAFTGDITRSGRGAYRNNASSSLTDGQDFFYAEGSALPTAAPGRVVWFYS